MIIVGGRGEWLGDATKKAVESGLRDLSLWERWVITAPALISFVRRWSVGFSCILIIVVVVVVVVVDFVALTGARCFQTTATSWLVEPS